MLVLTRKTDQRIVIRHKDSMDALELKPISLKHGQVRLGFEDDQEKFHIVRKELLDPNHYLPRQEVNGQTKSTQAS